MNVTLVVRPLSLRPSQFNDLGFAERLALWSMRMWGAGYRLGNSPDDVLAQSFEKAGIGHGRQCLEEFMVALIAGASRSIGLQCVCRKDIGEDEQLLLDILRLSQPFNTAGQASFLLEDLLNRNALQIAAVKAQALARAFNSADLRFAPRGVEACGAVSAQTSRHTH
jgi:hypothetical protein